MAESISSCTQVLCTQLHFFSQLMKTSLRDTVDSYHWRIAIALRPKHLNREAFFLGCSLLITSCNVENNPSFVFIGLLQVSLAIHNRTCCRFGLNSCRSNQSGWLQQIVRPRDLQAFQINGHGIFQQIGLTGPTERLSSRN